MAGKFKAADLIAFLSEVAGSAAPDAAADDSQSQDTEESSKEQPKKEQKQTPQVVRDLNLTDFDSLTDDEDAWLVAFYSGTLAMNSTGSAATWSGYSAWETLSC